MPVKSTNKNKKVKSRELVIENPIGILNMVERHAAPNRDPLDCFDEESYFFSDEEEDESDNLVPRKKVLPSIDYLMNSIASWQWAEIDQIRLPVVIRDGVQYAAVIMVQVKLLSKFPHGIPEEATRKPKHAMISKRMTELEACLFNCVNACSRKFDLGFHMYTNIDEIVTLADAVQFYFQLKEHFLITITDLHLREETIIARLESDPALNVNTNPTADPSSRFKAITYSKSVMSAIRHRCREIHNMNIKDMVSNDDFFKRLNEKLVRSDNTKNLIPPKYCTGFHLPNEGKEIYDLERGWLKLKEKYETDPAPLGSVQTIRDFEPAGTELAVLEKIQRSVLKRIVIQRASRAMFVKTKYTDHLRTLHEKMEKTLEDSSVPPFDVVPQSSTVSATSVNTIPGFCFPASSCAIPSSDPMDITPVPAQADVPVPAAVPVLVSATVPTSSSVRVMATVSYSATAPPTPTSLCLATAPGSTNTPVSVISRIIPAAVSSSSQESASVPVSVVASVLELDKLPQTSFITGASNTALLSTQLPSPSTKTAFSRAPTLPSGFTTSVAPVSVSEPVPTYISVSATVPALNTASNPITPPLPIPVPATVAVSTSISATVPISTSVSATTPVSNATEVSRIDSALSVASDVSGSARPLAKTIESNTASNSKPSIASASVSAALPIPTSVYAPITEQTSVSLTNPISVPNHVSLSSTLKQEQLFGASAVKIGTLQSTSTAKNDIEPKLATYSGETKSGTSKSKDEAKPAENFEPDSLDQVHPSSSSSQTEVEEKPSASFN